MSIYVDTVALPFRNWHMCHLYADTAYELHKIADALGLKREWFQDPATMPTVTWPHYDMIVGKRSKAIKLGAILQDRKQFVATAHRIAIRYHKGNWDLI